MLELENYKRAAFEGDCKNAKYPVIQLHAKTSF
jgi:hypothetical protein